MTLRAKAVTTFETSNYEIIKKALVNRDLKQALYDEGKVIMEGVLLTLHGQEHHQRRKLEHKVFQRDFFRYYEHELFPRTLEETIFPFLNNGSADLLDFGYRITMNLTADFAGIDRLKKTPEETENLLTLVKIFSQGATLVHSKRPHDEVNMEVTEALAVFEEKFLIPSKNRRLKILKQFNDNKLDEDDLPRDVLTVLLRNVDGINLDSEIIKREIAFYLQAGSHSTANSMTHALHDIFGWMEKHPEDKEKIYNDPIFLQRCVHESMRLHPASPVAWRKPTCPIELDKEIQMKQDDLLIMDLHNANRDKEIFGNDAEEFNPYRELDPNQSIWGLTFGIGLHLCFGRDLDGGLIA
ncbi:MAG: cytochrome P450, partial [Pseudomonadota bacterium]|nr:cytochrome P450 [Pseudomonadota bacterium]